MATDTIHADELNNEQKAALQKAATGMLKAIEVGSLQEMGLVIVRGDECSLTEEGQATLRTLIDPDHPLH